MKAEVNVRGWCVVDSANWAGVYAEHNVIAKVHAVYPSRELAEDHLIMLKTMPPFLHKNWIIVNVEVAFFEIEGAGGARHIGRW